MATPRPPAPQTPSHGPLDRAVAGQVHRDLYWASGLGESLFGGLARPRAGLAEDERLVREARQRNTTGTGQRMPWCRDDEVYVRRKTELAGQIEAAFRLRWSGREA